MKKIQLGTSDQKAAAVILGCMRIMQIFMETVNVKKSLQML